MAFPINPTNGQRITQNGVIYIYSSSTQSWRRDFNNAVDSFFVGGTATSTSTITGALVVVGGLGLGGNLNVGENVLISGNLTAASTVTFTPDGKNITLAPTNTGTVIINPNTTGTINNMSIGLTSPVDATFTDVTAATLTSTGVVSVGSDLYVTGEIYLKGITVKNYQWKIIENNYTAVPNDSLFVDTRLSTVTVTLPATPQFGDTIEFNDYAGNFQINPLIIDNNGKRIMGIVETLTVDSNGASNRLIYSGEDFGWRLGVVL